MGVSEDLPIEDHVGGALDRVRINIASTTMIGRQMKDNFHAFSRLIAKFRIEQVTFD